MHRWSGRMFRQVFEAVCWNGENSVMTPEGQVREPDAFVNAARVKVLCVTLRTCIKSVAFWATAGTWAEICDNEGNSWATNHTGLLPPHEIEMGRNNSINACWSKKVKDGPLPGAAWNPGSLAGSNPTIVWNPKLQYKPFSNPCGLMDLKMVKDNFDAWPIPAENGLPFREPPPGYDEVAMSFNETRGGLYGLPEPLEKFDWVKTSEVFGMPGANDRQEEYTKRMENSWCYNNPGVQTDTDRPCDDPSSASMSVSKKVAISKHNSSFIKYTFCLSWTAVNKGSQKVMTNPAHHFMTIPYNYSACSTIFRSLVINQRLKWICGAADPQGWTPSESDPVSNPINDPVPFMLSSSTSRVMNNVTMPEKFYPHLSGGKHHVWSPPGEVKQTCMKKVGSKYRCYKVPKFVCFPGGWMAPVYVKKVGGAEIPCNGWGQDPQYPERRPTDFACEQKMKMVGSPARINEVDNYSSPVLDSFPTKYNGPKIIHRKDANGALMFQKMDEPFLVYKKGGVGDCLYMANVTDLEGNTKLTQLVRSNNWCQNTCVNKDEVADLIIKVRTLKHMSLALNASFALRKLQLLGAKTVQETEVDITEQINGTIKEEKKLTKDIDNSTATYYKSSTTASRLDMSMKIQESVMKKNHEERFAKVEAFRLINITQHEEMVTKERDAKNEVIKSAYYQAWARMNATTEGYYDAIAALKAIRNAIRGTVAGWPAWVKSRYYKIEGLNSGSCMFPAQCSGESWGGKQVLQIVKDYMIKPGSPSDQVLWLKLFKPDAFEEATKFWASQVSTSADDWTDAKALLLKNRNPPVPNNPSVGAIRLGASHFLFGANFCAKEKAAGLHEQMDIMRTCEHHGYNREARCCSSSDLKFAKEVPKLLLNRYSVGGTKPWTETKEKFKPNEFINETANSFKRCGPKKELLCGKLKPSKAMKKQFEGLLHERNIPDHGRHVKYVMSPFKLKQEADTMKEF